MPTAQRRPTEQFGIGMGNFPGQAYGPYNPSGGNVGVLQPNTGQNLSQAPAWINLPGGGMVRNPDYNPPVINGWQPISSSVGGLVRPGATTGGGSRPQQTVGGGGSQQPPVTPTADAQQRTPINLQTNYGAGINNAQITTGVQAGQVYSPQQMQTALGNFTSAAAAPMPQLGLPMNQQQQADLAGRYAGSMGYQAQNLSTDAERAMQFGNMQHLLASQRARAQAGGGWGNLAARLGEISSAEDILRRNASLSLLGALGIG